MATRYIIQEDGVAHILLEDSSGALIKDGTAQASDDALLRIGPGVNTTSGSGLVTPLFTGTSVGGGAVSSPFYYQMMQNWFEAA